jgi:hypothetical protein
LVDGAGETPTMISVTHSGPSATKPMMRDPDPALALYRETATLRRRRRRDVAALPGTAIDVAFLLPRR